MCMCTCKTQSAVYFDWCGLACDSSFNAQVQRADSHAAPGESGWIVQRGPMTVQDLLQKLYRSKGVFVNKLKSVRGPLSNTGVYVASGRVKPSHRAAFESRCACSLVGCEGLPGILK